MVWIWGFRAFINSFVRSSIPSSKSLIFVDSVLVLCDPRSLSKSYSASSSLLINHPSSEWENMKNSGGGGGGKSMSDSKKQRQKAFEGRAGSVLKQASELATLCGTPACVVIYNPDDVIRPWRIWPENEAEFRKAIEIYKKHQARNQKATTFRGSRTASTSTSSDGDGVVGLNGLSARQAMMNDKRIQAGIDVGNLSHSSHNVSVPLPLLADDDQKPPQAAAVTQYLEAANSNNILDVVAAGDEATTADGKLWEDNEFFYVDELLNLCQECDEGSATNGHSLLDDIFGNATHPQQTNDAGQTSISAAACYEFHEEKKTPTTMQPAAEKPTTCVSSVSMSMPALAGNKRKAPATLSGFSQRRKMGVTVNTC